MRQAINALSVDVEETVGFRVESDALRACEVLGNVAGHLCAIEHLDTLRLEISEHCAVSRACVARFKLLAARLFCRNPVRYHAVRVANGCAASRFD